MARKATKTTKKEITKNKITLTNEAQKWAESMRKSKGSCLLYGTDKDFKPGDKISHPTFGNGLVDRFSNPGKIWVIFEGGEKLLIHGRTTL